MLRTTLIAAMLLLAPTAAGAIQLRWASGNTNLNFTDATRCTLIVAVDNGDPALPAAWHLIWVARGCGELAVKIDSTSTDTSTAHVFALGAPNRAEAAAHVKQADLQSRGTGFVTSARYILDLPAGSAGNFQVIASEAADTPPGRRIFRSGLVTFNGGIPAQFPPAIVYARADQSGTTFSTNIQGVGLGSARAIAVQSPDTTWSIPLQIDDSTDSTLSAHADVASELPAAILKVTAGGSLTSAIPLDGSSCANNDTGVEFSKFNFALYVDPDPGVSTKDFAFFLNHNLPSDTGPALFHLIYIRHVDSPPAETTFAHAWSNDLVTWRVDTDAFPNGQRFDSSDVNRWDRQSVWAPSIITSGDSTFMFYAGVQRVTLDQTIGYASTTDLDTCNTVWTRHDQPTWTTEGTSWAVRRRNVSGQGRQFRDPYLLRHPSSSPDSAGYYFLVFTAADSNDVTSMTSPLAVGIARNRFRGNLTSWLDFGFYPSTALANNGGIGQLEGPVLVPDKGSPTGWFIMFDNPGGAAQSARFERQTNPGELPSKTAVSSWTQPTTSLFQFLGNGPADSTVAGWQGLEYLSVSDNVQYLAGFTAEGVSHVFKNVPRFSDGPHSVQGIAISKINWSSRNFTLGTGNVTAVDDVDSPAKLVRLKCVEFRPLAHRVSWRITLPTAMEVRLDLFDVMGRHSRAVLHRVLAAGESVVTWDTTAEDGSLVRSGMYYARLSFEGGVRVAAFPIVR